MSQSEIYLTIVVPAYREEDRLHKIFEAISDYSKNHDFSTETIVVVDGSPDHTNTVANSYIGKIPNLQVIDRKKNMGKGYSVKEGVENAKGKYILFTDADNSTPLHQLDKLLKYVDTHDVIIGSRYCKGGELARPQPLYRIIGTRILNLIIQLLAVRGIHDTQCGFKLFRADSAKEIFKRQTIYRFSFDIEILAIARKLGYKIKEVGIKWYDDPHSTVSPIKDGIRMIKESWVIRKNLISKKY